MNGKFTHMNHVVQVKRLYSKSKLHHLWWPTRWWKLLILYLERIQISWVSKQSQGYISIRSKCQYSSRDTFICESSSSSINKSSFQVVADHRISLTGWNKAAMFHRDWEMRTCTLLFLFPFSFSSQLYSLTTMKDTELPLIPNLATIHYLRQAGAMLDL